MDETGRKWRKGLYNTAEDMMREVVTAQGRAPARLAKIGGDPLRGGPVGELMPGITPEDQAAAAARLSIDSAMTK